MPKPLAVFFASLALFAGPLAALENVWQGGTGGDWNLPANWSLGVVPTFSHQAVVESGSVALPNSLFVERLIVRGGSASSAGGQVLCPVEIGAAGLLELTGSDPKTFGRSVTNMGLIRWSGSGPVYLSDFDAQFLNQAGGVLELQSDALLTISPDNASASLNFQNHGTIRKTAGSLPGTSAFVTRFSPFPSTGTIEVLAGQISIPNGLQQNGAVQVSDGAQFAMGGVVVLGASGTFTGPGRVYVGVGTPGSAGINGTYRGSAPLIWGEDCQLYGPLTIASGATMRIEGSSPRELGNTLQNSGTVVWTGSGAVHGVGPVTNPAELANLATGVIDFQSDSYLGPIPSGDGNSFRFSSTGTIRKSGGSLPGTSTVRSLFGQTMSITGPVEVTAGDLSLENASYGGVCTVGSAASLSFSGGVSLQPNARFHGTGRVRLNASAQNGSAVGLFGTYLGSAALEWTDGRLNGSWTLGPGATLRILGSEEHVLIDTLSNAGTIVWLGSGPVYGEGFGSGPGPRLENLPSGIIELHSDAVLAPRPSMFSQNRLAFLNTGLLRKLGANTPPSGSIIQATPQTFPSSLLVGAIDLVVGTLTIHEGEYTGIANVAAGATLALAQSAVWRPAARFDGAGRVELGVLDGFGNSSVSLFGVYRGSAVLHWGPGSVSGELAVASGATLQIEGAGEHIFTEAIRNAGTVLWSGTGPVLGYGSPPNPAVFENQAGGVVELQSDAVFDKYTQFAFGARFINAGLLRKTSGAPGGASHFRSAYSEGPVAGTIEILAGQLAIEGGTYAAVASLSAGAELLLQGSAALQPGAVFQGPGQVRVDAVQGSSLFGTYLGSAPLVWNSGYLGGSWTLGQGARLNVAGPGDHFLGATLQNGGTVDWTGSGPVLGGFFAALQNLSTGLIELRSDAELRPDSPGKSFFAFQNAGLLRKSATAGLPARSLIASAMPPPWGSGGSAGTVEVTAGELVLRNVEYQGAATALAGTSLVLGGRVAFQPTGTFQGPGAIRLGEPPPLGPAMVTGTFAGPAALEWTDGAVSGFWSVGSGATLRAIGNTPRSFAGTLGCDGTISWEGGAIITVAGASLQIGATGLLDLRCDADFASVPGGGMGANTIVAAGTIRKSEGAPLGRSLLEGNFDLAATGRIEVLAGVLELPLGYAQAQGTVLLEGGSLRSPQVQILGGTLRGRGRVEGTVFNGGRLEIEQSASPGLLSIVGSYTQDPMGTLQVRLGAQSGVSDRLEVTGSVTLAGSLQVGLLGGTPLAGSSFQPIRYLAGAGATGTPSVVAPVLPPAQILVGSSTLSAFQLTVRSSLTAWREFYFGVEAGDPLVAGNLADPNHNGLPNLLEYAFGLDPLSPSFAPLFARLPRLSLESSSGDGQLHLTLTFQRRIGSDGQELSYVVEAAESLFGGWDASGLLLEPVGLPVPDPDGVTERVTVRVMAPITGSPIRFLRLRVTEL